MNIDITRDHHMHSLFSDGSKSIDDMALSAVRKGLSQITITDHMPLPYDSRYAMDRNRVDQYRLAVKKARSIHSHDLEINMGIEIEFLPEFRFWVYSISKMGWDCSIASVHTLWKNKTPFIVNGTRKEFDALLEEFGNDPQALYRAYWQTVQTALDTGWFNIAGHLDVIKKHDAGNIFFNESDPVYRKMVMQTLDIIKRQNMKMEINMSGFNHPVKEQYPSAWIIREAVEKGIQIVPSSDAHSPEAIGQYFDRINDLVKKKAIISF